MHINTVARGPGGGALLKDFPLENKKCMAVIGFSLFHPPPNSLTPLEDFSLLRVSCLATILVHMLRKDSELRHFITKVLI